MSQRAMLWFVERVVASPSLTVNRANTISGHPYWLSHLSRVVMRVLITQLFLMPRVLVTEAKVLVSGSSPETVRKIRACLINNNMR